MAIGGDVSGFNVDEFAGYSAIREELQWPKKVSENKDFLLVEPIAIGSGKPLVEDGDNEQVVPTTSNPFNLGWPYKPLYTVPKDFSIDFISDENVDNSQIESTKWQVNDAEKAQTEMCIAPKSDLQKLQCQYYEKQLEYLIDCLDQTNASEDITSVTNCPKQSYTSAWIEHQKELMTYTKNAYEYHGIMTKVIFWVVVVLVISGVFLSFLQFKADTSLGKGDNGGQKAHFKLGSDGLEFSSSVIGLIILFMSFFFFSTYVDKVYTIRIAEPIALESMKE